MEYDPNSEYVRKYTKWRAKLQFYITYDVKMGGCFGPGAKEPEMLSFRALVKQRIPGTEQWETIATFGPTSDTNKIAGLNKAAAKWCRERREAYDAAHGIIQTRPEDEVL